MNEFAYIPQLRDRLRSESSSLRQSAETVRARYPKIFEETVAAADLALAGKHVLPGTMNKPRFVGNPIDWNTNPVGDTEYVWGLNRMEHWITLGRAALLTGKRGYAQRIIEEWNDWIDRCPCPTIVPATPEDDIHHALTGCHPWRLLEAGIRCFGSWRMSLFYLDALDMLEPELVSRVAGAFHDHGTYLANFSPSFWPEADHNHLVMEMLGLLEVACLFPEFSEAEGWKSESLHQLERCLKRQITREGGQIEGCPHYHNLCLQFFSRVWLLARKHNATLSETFQARYWRAVDYLILATRPTGFSVPWGDSDVDQGILVTTATTVYKSTGDCRALTVMARLIGWDGFLIQLQTSVWDIPDVEALAEKVRSLDAIPPDRVCWHRELDQATARSGWERDSLNVFIACRIPQNGHAHIDPGSFDFCALGKALLVDPGRFTYRDDADRYDFKRAASHNMLLIDERDPFAYVSTWKFGQQRKSAMIDVSESGDVVAITVEHHNYYPAIHRRTCFLAGSEAMVLMDVIEGLKPEQTVQLYFHVDSLSLKWDTNRLSAKTCDPGANVMITRPEGMTATSFLPGRISEKLDLCRPSTRVRFSDEGGNKRRVFYTLIVPFGEAGIPQLDFTISPNPSGYSSIRIGERIFELPLGMASGADFRSIG